MTTTKKPSKKLVVRDLDALKGGVLTTETKGEAESPWPIGKNPISGKTSGPSPALSASGATATRGGPIAG